MTPEEINIRIAEITGDTDEHDWDFRIGVCTRCGSEEGMEDPPRTPERGCVRDFWGDERAALWAATRVGLLDQNKHGGLLTQNYNSQEWSVEGMEPPHSTYGPTPPAAICNAILTLKDKQ